MHSLNLLPESQRTRYTEIITDTCVNLMYPKVPLVIDYIKSLKDTKILVVYW